jgi:hypothetical protein
MAPLLISPAFFQSYYSVHSIDKVFYYIFLRLAVDLSLQAFRRISSGNVEITIDAQPISAAA